MTDTVRRMSKTSKRCPQCNRIVPAWRVRQGWTSEFCSTQCIDAHFAKASGENAASAVPNAARASGSSDRE